MPQRRVARRDSGRTFLRALRAYRAASLAAQASDEEGLDAGLQRAFDLQRETQAKLAECNLGGQDSTSAMLQGISQAYRSLQQPIAAVDECPDYDCLSREGARLEDILNTSLDELLPIVEAADDGCLRAGGRVVLDSLRAYREVAVAAQEGDERAIGDAYDRGYDLELEAADQMRSCPSVR